MIHKPKYILIIKKKPNTSISRKSELETRNNLQVTQNPMEISIASFFFPKKCRVWQHVNYYECQLIENQPKSSLSSLQGRDFCLAQ